MMETVATCIIPTRWGSRDGISVLRLKLSFYSHLDHTKTIFRSLNASLYNIMSQPNADRHNRIRVADSESYTYDPYSPAGAQHSPKARRKRITAPPSESMHSVYMHIDQTYILYL